MRVAVLASGRGSNFDALCEASRKGDSPYEIVVLGCDRPDAAVIPRAESFGVPVARLDPGTRRGEWAPEGIESLRATLADRAVDALCLAGFMRILPPEIVREYRGRILNIHPSLLPSFPGLRPHRQALRAGVKVSGCTVHFVDEGVDTGAIVLQTVVPVRDDDTEDTLAARILEQEHRIYPEAVCALAQGRLRIEGRRVSLAATTPSNPTW